MNIDWTGVVFWAIIGIAIALIVYVVLGLVFIGTALGFTMTPELKKEEVAVKMCIMFNITDTTCNDLYGGIGPKIGGKH